MLKCEVYIYFVTGRDLYFIFILINDIIPQFLSCCAIALAMCDEIIVFPHG